MNRQIRYALTLLGITVFLVSCGGSKRATRSPKVTQTQPAPPKPKAPEPEPAPTPAKKTASLSYKEKIQNYIYEYKAIAKKEMQAFGIPASITLAQGILESGAGYGTLSQTANNHFGIKCHDWTGDRVYHDDDKAQECFRKYTKASESYKDHSLFLKNRKRYAKLFTFKKDDYKAWARGLKAAGYATDPKYPAKLISIIERYQLYRYDEEVLGKVGIEKPASPDPKPNSVSKITPVRRTVDKIPTASKKDKSTSNTTPGISGHQVQHGETLYSIAQQYGTTVAALQSYNDLIDTTIAAGQILRVTAPKVKSSVREHIVKKGETVYSISRQYNCTTDALRASNQISNNIIVVGQVLRIPNTNTSEDEEF